MSGIRFEPRKAGPRAATFAPEDNPAGLIDADHPAVQGRESRGGLGVELDDGVECAFQPPGGQVAEAHRRVGLASLVTERRLAISEALVAPASRGRARRSMPTLRI